MLARSLRYCAIVALRSGLLAAQVVFSRRVYRPRGRTNQQIWAWNPVDGSFKPLTHSERNHFRPSCSKDGRHMHFLSGGDANDDHDRWSLGRKTGEERRVPAASKPAVPPEVYPPGCEHAAWTQDRSRFACSSGRDVVICAAATKKEMGRANFNEQPTTPNAIAWSPDGKWLLVGTEGQNDNSTSRQSD